MKFATALLLAGMFVGTSAFAGEDRPCTSGTNGEFSQNESKDANLIDRLSGSIKTPASNPPPAELPSSGTAH